jgi:uncharacterized SAM-binding protein YcdF (DUF218 family)
VSRLVAVLGYSERRGGGIHSVCATRLAHAEALVDPDCAIVLSGEVELMREAWKGPTDRLLLDPEARNTAGNAAGIAAIARQMEASEVLIVTSRWHERRAALLVRAALRGSGIEVRTSSPDDPPGARLRVRELAAMAAAPFQAARLR